MSPQARSHETQARLLATTATLLRERGYHGAGLTEIVRDSGVPKGSLYHHFPDGKAQLAAASLRLTGGRLVARLEQFADRAGSVADGIRAFCDMYIAELHASDYRRGCPLATVALESAALDDGVREEVGAAMAAMVDLLAVRITAEAPASADPRGLATEVVAAVEGALLLAKATRSTVPVETVRDRLTARVAAELHGESR
jgi:TetR/AcrR family transcriptional repressor of lmrAB and yxaGH operons